MFGRPSWSSVSADSCTESRNSARHAMDRRDQVPGDDDNVYMLKMRLQLLGDFEVLAAEGWRERLRDGRGRAARPDLDGPRNARRLEAARRLKSNSQTQHVPIIALSRMRWPAPAKRPSPRDATSLTPSRSNSSGLSRRSGECSRRASNLSAGSAALTEAVAVATTPSIDPTKKCGRRGPTAANSRIQLGPKDRSSPP